MPAIILPDRWRQQPGYPTEIDRTNPITIGLANAGYGNWSAGTRSPGTPAATGAVTRSAGGEIALWQGYVGARGTTFPRGQLVNGTAQTVMVRAALSSANTSSLISVNASTSWSNPYTYACLRGNDSTTPQIVTATSGAFYTADGSAGFFEANNRYTSYGYIRNDSAVSFRRNGAEHSTGTLTAGVVTAFTSSTGLIEIGSNAGNESSYSADVSSWAIWCRALNDAEYREAANAPYAIFKKPQAKVYFLPSAGGGGATLTADSGTYTLTGTAVTLKADRKLAADSGSYAITGTDVSLKVGRKLSADSGTYSVTGTAVNFLRGYALAAESGSYSVSGTDAALRVGRLLSAASGSYVLSGSAAALQYQPAGSYSLTAESGAYTLTGTAATLKVSRKLTAESGSYSLTGSDATFKRGFSVSAGAGSYTLTGTNVAFARTYVLGAETGAYTLTGSDVGLTWSAAPVVETPTHGGPSIYGKAVFREKEFRREYDEQIRRIDEAKLAERLIREDEELIIIMAALAA